MEYRQFDFYTKTLEHEDHISRLREGYRPYALNVEIDLTNGCNHRCSFCQWGSYIQENRASLPESLVSRTLKELKSLGTKSINWTGGGEPTVHKSFYKLLNESYELGLENGLLTNGSLLKNDSQLLDQCVWIRVSMAGGDRESYRKVQGRDDFDKVLNNLERLSSQPSDCELGVAFLVNESNYHSVLPFVKRLKDTGIDYLQLRRDMYCENPKWWREEVVPIIEESERISGNMRILGARYMDAQENLTYPKKCYAHHFVAAINAEGNVCFCKNTRDNPEFWLGNIHEDTLTNIWKNSEVVKKLEKGINPLACATFCKNMDINTAIEDVMNGKVEPKKTGKVTHGNFL